MNLESENLIIAIGVLSLLADEAYDHHSDDQSPVWKELRGAIFYMTQKIERIAKEEVQR